MLPLLVASGVDSLKIEGRMKSIFYVGGVVRIYRAALEYLKALPEDAWKEPEKIRFPETFMDEISRSGTRGMTENFIIDKPGSSEMIYSSSRAEQGYEPVAVIRGAGEAPFVEIRNTVRPGEEIEYMLRGVDCNRVTIIRLEDEEGRVIEKANPGNKLFVFTEPALLECEVNAIFRRKKKQLQQLVV